MPSEAPEINSVSSTPTSVHIKWQAPHFINGRLLGYRLRLLTRNQLPKVKDVPTSSLASVTEVMTLLKPETEYIVKVAARNRVGLGPEAHKTITTPPKEPSKYFVFPSFL